MFEAQEIRTEHKNFIEDVAYDYFSDRKATYCSSDQQIKVWNKTTGKWTISSSLKAHRGAILKVTWAHPKFGQVLATCSCDGTATVWEEIVDNTKSEFYESDTKNWVHRKNIIDSKNSVTDIKFCPKSQGLQLATCSKEGFIRIYEAPDTNKLSKWTLKHEIQCELSLSCLDWSSSLSELDSPLIAVGSNATDAKTAGKVVIYEYNENNRKWIELVTINSIIEPVRDLAFAPNLERSFHILGVATMDVRILKLTPIIDKQISPTKIDIVIASKFDHDGFPVRRVCWKVCGEVLASIGDDIRVRMFNSSSVRAELCILPEDEDEACHSAFYYAIRSGNIEVVDTLINRWPGSAVCLDKFDEILSRPYEELKLKNVLLTKEMEIFVENKLIDLRFFSNSSGNDQTTLNNLNNIKERVKLVIENIRLLKEEYSGAEIVDEKFLFIARFIAQNVNILKRQLKSTYARLPWEEIEFCLISFVSSHCKQQEINVFYRTALNKSKIINYLEYFAKNLEDELDIIEGVNVRKLVELPKLNREKVVAAIVSRNHQFQELYNDFQQVRDIYSLQKISCYIHLALSANPEERTEQLIITRALQVTGEFLKNTLESPNLSNTTSELLLLSLPKNTRELIINLRNSLSHANSLNQRREIEKNTDASFFVGVQNDTKKINNVINDIFYNNKIKTIRILLEKVAKSDSLDEIKEVAEILNNVELELEKTVSGRTKIIEHEKIKKLIKELNDNIIDKTDCEKELLNKINNIINSVGTQLENITVYITGFTMLKSFSMTFFDETKIDHNVIRGIKFRANLTLQNMNPKIKPHSLKEIAELAIEIFNSVSSRMQRDYVDEITRIVFEIFNFVKFGTDDIYYIEGLRNKLNEKNVLICSDKQLKVNITAQKYNDQLAIKLSELKNILNVNLISNQLIEILSAYQNDLKLQPIVEMLILDILSILGSSRYNYLKNNNLFLDDYTPLLNGHSLRNHLAHHNALIDILLSDPSLAVILNAIKLVSENVLKGKKIIGKLVKDQPSKYKYNKSIITITNQTGLFDALQEGNLRNVKSYLRNGADVRARTIDSSTALHFAAKGPSLRIVEFLLDQNLNLNVKDINGQSPLHVAASHGRTDIINFLLKEQGLYVDDLDNYGKTPLHMAAQYGFKDAVEVLLDNKANTVIKDIAGLSPIYYAIRNSHIDVAKFLLTKDANVDINETMGGFTPLHEAAERGNIELVNFLLKNKANVNARNDNNWIPLHAAALNGHLEVLNALIMKGADVNARVLNGCTPLHYAVENGHEKIANILLSRGAHVNAVDKAYNNTPLHYVAKDGYKGIVKLLLKNKADANIVTVEGLTPLHFAVQDGHLEIVTVLLNHGVSINAKDNGHATPIHFAAQSGHVEISDFLIKNGANVNTKDINKTTPLHLAALQGHKHVVDILIKNNAEVNSQNIKGKTPLYNAAMGGCKNIIALLINNNAKVDIKSDDGSTSLHAAAANGHGDAIVYLIQNNAEVNVKNNHGFTPLHTAAVGGHKNVLELLIKNQAEVESEGFAGGTPLRLAVTTGNKEIVRILATNGANVNIKSGNSTPLLSAIKYNQIEIVELLIAYGADTNSEDGQPLFFAVNAGYRDIVNVLLKNKARVNMSNKYLKSLTLLHLAASKGHKEIVCALITNSAKIDAMTIGGSTSLYLAAEGGYQDVVEVLITHGAKVNTVNAEGTSLHIAAGRGHHEVVKILLNNGARTNIKDNKNRTALELAVAHGHLKVVKILLQDKNIDINARCYDDWTILHIASQGNDGESNIEMVKYLVKEGSDINARNSFGSKSVHIAAREGYTDIVAFFLSNGLSVDETGGNNQTLLHYAAIQGHLEVVKYLIAQGADVNAKDANDVTPMHIAATCGFRRVIEMLSENGAIYNAMDKFFRRPIELATDTDIINLLSLSEQLVEAVKRNSWLEVESYIKSGALLNAKNVDNVTSLHHAAWKGYIEVANILLRNNANPNAVGKTGLTPLHYAAKFSHLKVVKALLSHGAIYNAVSDGGKTPSDFTVDKGIKSLLNLISQSFKNVQNGNSRVINDLNKIKHIDLIKAVMNARNEENKTLVVAAINSKFSKTEELKQISQGDVGTQITLALMLFTKGDYQGALSIFKSAFEKRKQILGPDNPGTLDLQFYIAKALYKKGAYQDALNLLEEVFEKQTSVLGLNNEDALNTRSTFALVLHRQGKDKEAFNIFQEIYQKQKQILGPYHSDTLETAFHMALVLERLGKYEEALSFNKEVLEKRKETLGIDHPAVISAQNNIALVLTSQGKYEEALNIYKEVLENKKMILGINHADTLRTLRNIAGILFKQMKYHEALKIQQEVLTIQKTVFGQNHPETLNTQYNLANMLFSQGKWISALKAYKACLEQRKAVFGPSHSSVLDIVAKLEIIRD